MSSPSRRRVRLGYALLVVAYFLVQIFRGSPAAVKSCGGINDFCTIFRICQRIVRDRQKRRVLRRRND